MKFFVLVLILFSNLYAQKCSESYFERNTRLVRSGLGGRTDDKYFPHYSVLDTSFFFNQIFIKSIYEIVPNLVLAEGLDKDDVSTLYTFYKDPQSFNKPMFIDQFLIDIEQKFNPAQLHKLHQFVKMLEKNINSGLPSDEKVYPFYAAFRKTDGTVTIGPNNLHIDIPYLVSITTLIGKGTEYETSNYYHKLKQVDTGDTMILSGQSRVKYPPLHRSPVMQGKRLTLLIQWGHVSELK